MSEVNEIEIKLLPFPLNVRTRPSTYVGGLENPNNILREVIDNALDESYSSYCDKIFIETNFEKTGFNVVADNGRGLPIKMSSDIQGQTQAEVATSSLHAGSKFRLAGDNQTDASIGMNGLGIKASNALSTKFIVLSKVTQDNYDKSIPEVKSFWESKGPRSKNNIYYYLSYEEGVKNGEGVETLKNLSLKFLGKELPEGYSTYVMLVPDPKIWESTKTSLPMDNLQYFTLIQEKFYKKKVEVLANGEEIRNSFTPYKYEVVRTVVPADTSKNKQVQIYVTFEVSENLSERKTQGSVNSLTVNGGHHIQIFESCYREALTKYYNFSHNYIFNGLKCLVIVLCNETLWSGQTKENLKSIVKVKSSDFSDVVKDIIKIFKSNTDYWDLHVQRLNAYAESMTNISAIDKIKKLVPVASEKGDKSRSLVPKKVSEASAPLAERSKCELYICEGNSAAGTLIKARNSRYHAVLPLRGRPKQTTNLDFEQVLDNKEMYDLVATVGMGMNQYYNLDNPRYGKIIIATDADDDGSVIAATLVGTILTHMTFLIDEGMLFVAESPIYRQNGKYFFPSDIDEKTGKIPGLDLKKTLTRYKGLGELNTVDAKKAFFDPDNRRLIRVTPEGAREALKILSSTAARKDLMESNKLLTNPYKLK